MRFSPARLLLLLSSSLLWGCQLSGGSTASTTPAPSPWTLVWEDDFAGRAGTLPDPRYWNHDIGNRDTGGWGNEELEFYTRDPRNASMDGQGQLLIRALKNTAPLPCWNGPVCPYTSARITTLDKVSFLYGKVEARIQVPPGRGFWPAFWSMGQGVDRWPDNGELDIMEWVGDTPDTVYGALHGPGYSGAQGLSGEKRLPVDLSDAYHTYAVIRRPGEIEWLVDGAVYARVTPADLPKGTRWVFDQPFYLLLNLAVGGEWPGTPPASTVFPGVMKVDYVRIWKEAGS